MRTAIAKRVEHESVLQEMGVVARVDRGSGEARYQVEHDGVTYDARRAVSCLVEPEEGDQVLFAGRPSTDLYVLAVLERPTAAITVQVPGDLTLRVDKGRFAVAAVGVDLVSSRDLSLTSHEVAVRTSHAHVLAKQIELVGERLFGDVEAVKMVTRAFERVAERVVERVKRSYRYIEESDHVRSGQLDYVAEESLRLKGENAFVQADGLVKVDGDQIHLG